MRRLVIAVAAAAALGVTLSAIAGAASKPKSKPKSVKVVNTPKVKLDPSANTVRIDGVPKVSLDSLPAVTLAGVPPIQLDESAARVIHKLPTQFVATADLTGIIGGSACTTASFTGKLPQDTPVFVETVFVSFNNVAPVDGPRASLNVGFKASDGTSSTVWLPVKVDTPDGFGSAAGQAPVGLKVVRRAEQRDGEFNTLTVCMNRGAAGAGVSGRATIVGRVAP